MTVTSRIEDLRRRVQKDPASIAFAQLAEECRRAGDFQEAVDTCRAGLALHPGYLSARVTLGRALIELEQLDDAQAELDIVLSSAPENLAAIRGLAEIFHRRGALAEALKHYRSALALARNDPDLERTVSELSRAIEPKTPAPVVDGLSFEDMASELMKLAPPPAPPPSVEPAVPLATPSPEGSGAVADAASAPVATASACTDTVGPEQAAIDSDLGPSDHEASLLAAAATNAPIDATDATAATTYATDATTYPTDATTFAADATTYGTDAPIGDTDALVTHAHAPVAETNIVLEPLSTAALESAATDVLESPATSALESVAVVGPESAAIVSPESVAAIVPEPVAVIVPEPVETLAPEPATAVFLESAATVEETRFAEPATAPDRLSFHETPSPVPVDDRSWVAELMPVHFDSPRRSTDLPDTDDAEDATQMAAHATLAALHQWLDAINVVRSERRP